jgi:hypothetical protein
MNTTAREDEYKEYLDLANMGFSVIRASITENELAYINDIADSLHNLGDWESTSISLNHLFTHYPSHHYWNNKLLDIFNKIKKPTE